ncbi:Uncharacterized conserved protein YloU, alkaline shock protein (Asp23) family [Paenibacillus algorifonticola]|uniref:Uncharacterized conserved protein YloU, alkaline shock protein (Asp23) family n=1 Tax=Paenibacillus algorifonticola TaxID=684063 RepID=A0A1I1YUA5_9BACL|nr:Asp23/Gls24 family envelope stress response protein [Paenibacillus algorifonticola]SFE23184.1 Uncharacterized conserved protein YloU, alkaline shock protein (Asp23) family [Paenibacillus algorifonticola]
MLIQGVLGKITISKEVVSKIIGKTAIATAGVASMSTGLVEGLAQKLTGNSLIGGIELKKADTGLDINLSIVVHYGIKMQEVCMELQRNVREAVEMFTGITIGSIHIKVHGISVAGN